MLNKLPAACLILLALSAHADSKLKLDTAKSIRIEYLSPSWNKNPNQADSSSILFRDGNSGKIARVELQETGANTGQFVGYFRISWQTNSEISPELYIPPQGMFATADQMKKIDDLIKENLLLRKPFFMNGATAGSQAISLFDTKEQALAAMDQFRKSASGKPIVDNSAIDAQRRSEAMTEANRQAEIARVQENERVRMALDELKKKDDLKKQQEQMDAAEKARRQAEAKRLADLALKDYKAEKYKDAESKYSQATELDPFNNSFYFQYGVTLFRNENFNKSIVVLKLADGPGVNPIERDYFLALNYLKTKEFTSAYQDFEKIKAKNDKTLSPSSSFFMGVIDFQKERYEPAKTNFEYTLDQSSDPAMDKQAEAYIEQIANIMAFAKERAKKFIFTLNFGLQSDSNILAYSNTQIDAGVQTGLSGYRWMYGGSIEWRPLYSEKHEWSTLLSVSDLYSMDNKFKANTDFQNTDPLVMSLAFPYKFKGTLFSKAFMLGLTPSVETMSMNADATGSREQISNSTVLKTEQTYVMNENWFSAYNLELRSDKSLLTTADDDNQSASKITLMTVNTFFKNKEKTEANIWEAGVAQNTANGKNSTYFRYDLAGTYMMPAFWQTSFTARLGIYNAKYGLHTTGRTDSNTGLTLGLRKPLSDSLSWTLNGTYTINKSTLDSSDYKKYLLMTVLTWNTSL